MDYIYNLIKFMTIHDLTVH